MLSLGVIGYGYWGPNLVRNFHETPGCRVAAVCDLDPRKLELVRARYPGIDTGSDVEALLQRPDVDAVLIATPVSTHFDLARRALAAGKHVLVEKPLADSAERCDQLIAAAAQAKRLLMVDHTFPYTGAVRKIRELVDTRALGDLLYYDSTRINLGLFQSDVSVLWDLAIHDLSIVDYLFVEKPVAVSGAGHAHVAGHPVNTAFLTLYFRTNCIAHINVNWLAPVKVRLCLIGGSEKMVVYDDTEVTEKVKVYDKGITVNPTAENIQRMRVGYRAGDMYAPLLDGAEALRRLAAEFRDCVREGREPVSSAACGRRLVRILEAADQSLARQGAVVEL
jgi:predicted dehydrogenase